MVVFTALGRARLLSKAVLMVAVGLFGLLVASGNVLDFDSNWTFVRHVLSMDSMEPWFSGKGLSSRAIHDEKLQHLAYFAIIVGEALFGLLCFTGGVLTGMGLVLSDRQQISRGKVLYTLGATLAIAVWYGGFCVVGGEYFAMWANQWNGQMKAYAFITFILMSLVYVGQAEGEM